jgi:hypothetical protein
MSTARRSPTGSTSPRGRRGRAKGTRNIKTIVHEIASERHAVQEQGRLVRLTTVELLIRKLNGMAMSGNVRAAKYLDRLRGPIESPLGQGGGLLVVPEAQPPAEWIRQQHALNMLRTRPE